MEVSEIGLARFVAALRAAGDEDATAETLLDWKRQARETVWLVATAGGRDVGAAIGVGGWHSPVRVARCEVSVAPAERGRGHGSALLGAVGAWAHALGYDELTAPVQADGPASLAWAERRGYREVGRDAMLVLELRGLAPPAVAAPQGIEIATWAERPELARGMHTVALEAYPDVPGEADTPVPPFAEWLAMDMEGVSDRPEATFIALVGDLVVGYGMLSLVPDRPDLAGHGFTGVLRAWRGRGIAGAIKRAEIAWAIAAGYERLETHNDDRNEPVRRLNLRHGYALRPGVVTVRGPIASGS